MEGSNKEPSSKSKLKRLQQISLELNCWQRYETSGVIVEAIQYNGDNINNIIAFITSKIFDWDSLEVGDYVVNNLTGIFYKCEKERFKRDYKKK